MVREYAPFGEHAGKKSVACFCGAVLWFIAVFLVVFLRPYTVLCVLADDLVTDRESSLSEGQDLACLSFLFVSLVLFSISRYLFYLLNAAGLQAITFLRTTWGCYGRRGAVTDAVAMVRECRTSRACRHWYLYCFLLFFHNFLPTSIFFECKVRHSNLCTCRRPNDGSAPCTKR
jgi:hypothetical protein